ncbi:hypothetical protein A464_4388 [Salmonella bongori N268-08]|uniref:Uncharacterized protein n=1 Tax=Salmonella bongori N268-08 TaxID=1197719 RepID=S5NG56_SALBN|nr:hypothetical protein A464_4388 [Salmonella bongori N268-08]
MVFILFKSSKIIKMKANSDHYTGVHFQPAELFLRKKLKNRPLPS